MSNMFGRDVNNPGASGTRGAIEIPSSYFSGIVEDIIINEQNGIFLKYKSDGSNIGEAKIRLVPDDWGLPIEKLQSVFPLEMNVQDFPLVGEQVIVFKAFNALFYTRKLSAKRKLTENTTTEIQKIFQEENLAGNRDSRELSILGVPTNYTESEINTTDTFPLNPDVRPVRSNKGDIIFQGRFGSAIRMGSSLFNSPSDVIPKANVLITAGFWKTPKQLSTGKNITPYSLAYENINEDKSSIWMVENQEVKFQGATNVVNSPAHLLSSPQKTKQYTGAQIFINSDRVILNSKENEISLFARREINLTSVGAITLDTENDIFLRSFSEINIKSKNSIYIESDEVSIVSKKLTQTVTGDYGLTGKRIFIGKYGDLTQPMVLGRNLASFLTAALSSLTQLTTVLSTFTAELGSTLTTPGAYTVTVGGALIPVVPAGVVSLVASAASVSSTIVPVTAQLNTLLSGTTPTGAIFYSQDNFVSKTNS